MELKQIASFAVDHTKLVEGMYTSRVDGDVTTYDIRMVKPNCGTYLPYPAIHSFEHLFATYVRSSELSDQVIYVGPMGCRTGFYFLVRNMEPKVAIKLVNDMLAFIAQPSRAMCPAPPKRSAATSESKTSKAPKQSPAKMIPILKSWTPADCAYEK